MNVLRYGSRGSEVELLQLGLNRAGFGPVATDGAFGSATRAAVMDFQSANNLAADGIVGRQTRNALTPWFTGYTMHSVRRGDSIYKIAARYGTTLRAVELANPNLDPLNLQVGTRVVVPLPFSVVPTTISWSSSLVNYCVRGITARYPFVSQGEFGASVMGKPLRYLAIGEGTRTVMYNAEHHANEWITTPVLMKFVEDLASARAFGGEIRGVRADEIFTKARIYIVPAVNPDAMDLVTGALNEGQYYTRARQISANFPAIPFPSGWKANISGTDLNLQYPAGWEQAKKNKYEQGFTRPAPRDFVGTAPLSAPESRAMHDLTRRLDPALTLSYHTQGNVIYWRYLDYDPAGARRIGECFAAASGYALEETPYASGFAGYKDWFIEEYNRPGYTIECGMGISPLPLSQFAEIYRANLGILIFGALGGC